MKKQIISSRNVDSAPSGRGKWPSAGKTPREAPKGHNWVAKKAVSPPIKCHGGKYYQAKEIVQIMPDHLHYVEPYFGGGAVLLARNPEGTSEVVNDLNGELSNFWRVLQDAVDFRLFCRIVQAVPFSQVEWGDAMMGTGGCEVERAVRFFIRCRQSRAGQMKDFAPLTRNRTRRNMNEQASAWWSAIDGLPEVHERLKRVVILNDDALNVIQKQDGPGTLHYCDPPYLPSTRVSPDVYEFEMTEDDHVNLLSALNAVAGKVILSGYRSVLYDSLLLAPRWRRLDRDMPNHSGGGETKQRRTECLWLNYWPLQQNSWVNSGSGRSPRLWYRAVS